MFNKIGLTPLPASRPAWMHSHAFIPNAFLLNSKTIRIVLAFWDANKIGRAGYLDVSASNPLEVVGFSNTPSLDIGTPGAFDDNGISPLCLVRRDDGKLWMYYAGWQLNDKVRYLLYAGLAESSDDGVHFARVKKTPVLERSDREMIIRSGSFVYRDGNRWKMMYVGGSETVIIAGKCVPSYHLLSMQSEDGIHWPDHGTPIFSPDMERKEFGFGRPHVLKEKNIWKMWYGYRHMEKGYLIGYAESEDGETWARKDDRMKAFNNDNWPHDYQMRAYACILPVADKTYMFYSGNDYGRDGVCVAKLI
jgi:hypothetical protein